MPFRKRKKLDYSYNHIQNTNDPLEIKRIFDRAYTKALKFLSYRPRSTKEVYTFLAKKEFDQELINQVIELLNSQKFINDKDFAEWWTRGRQSGPAKGKYLIKQELREKGISEKLIEETLDTAKDDYETAKFFLEKRKARFEGLSPEEYFQKAAGFLQRRGFSWEVVKRVLKENT